MTLAVSWPEAADAGACSDGTAVTSESSVLSSAPSSSSGEYAKLSQADGQGGPTWLGAEKPGEAPTVVAVGGDAASTVTALGRAR